MNSISKLSDSDLLGAIDNLVNSERTLLTKILFHFKEIERRRLFSDLGFKSLFEYAVKRLGYSEDQAYRRVEAMRTLKDLPELQEKIDSGALNLTHLTLARKFFKSEAKFNNTTTTKLDQLKIFEKLEGKSAREAEKVVLSLSTNPISFHGERIKQVSQDHVEIKMVAAEELLKKIEKLKGLLAHSNPNISTAELFDKLCDLGIQKWDIAAPKSKIAKSDLSNSATFRKRCVTKISATTTPSKRTAIPSVTQRLIWQNANSECENCKSRHALEIEHIQPVARGGENKPQNLKLLCRSCNQRSAIKGFGQQQMDFYF